MEYRGYEIEYDPPGIPIRAFDWRFHHKAYDGPEDGRCGTAYSLEYAQQQIDEIIEEEEDAIISKSGIEIKADCWDGGFFATGKNYQRFADAEKYENCRRNVLNFIKGNHNEPTHPTLTPHA